MSSTITQTIARPARTAVQGGLAFAVTEMLDAYDVVPMDDRQYGATLLVLTILFGWVQNLVENGIGKAFLRRTNERPALVVDKGGNA